MKFLLARVVINAVALWVATLIVNGVALGEQSFWRKVGTLLFVAAIFGVVNAVLKPLIRVVALPLYLLTLGLITFVVNAFLFWLASWLAGDIGLSYRVHGFVAAVLGALVVTIVSFVLSVIARVRR